MEDVRLLIQSLGPSDWRKYIKNNLQAKKGN